VHTEEMGTGTGVTYKLCAGWVFDTWGSYRGVRYALGGLATIGVAIVMAIPRERRFAE
jgi:hypothetical protein